MVILERLIDKGVDVDKLKPMMDMVQEYNRNRAAEDFATAITKFQELMPPVEKTNPVFGKNRDAGPQYHFASLSDILEMAQPHLSACRIVVTFDSESVQAGLKVVCRVRVGTHVEQTTFTLPMPTIPNANGSQIAGAALQYAKRYAMCAALNIRTKGEDNDAADQAELLTDEQVAVLNGLFADLREAGAEVNQQLFWEWIHGKGTDKGMHEMLAKDFTRAVDFLDRKRRKVAKK
jgi:hypothetical protein